ncbi:MAG: N-acetylglucosamine kinase [Thermomicrobiales bacterium]
MSPLDHRSDLIMGVDGGGSKTTAVVVDRAGCERGRAIAGSSNYTVVGAEEAAAQVTRAVTEAVKRADGDLPLCSLWAGLSGINRPGAREALLSLLQPLASDVRLTNDAELLFAALTDEIGVVLIAGTGSIALGRDPSGATARSGGWGHLVGDEGSGYDLGRRALQAAARAADGRGPETSLLGSIMDEWGLDQPMSIIDRVYRSTEKAEIAALSSLVFADARAGDLVARQIADEGATDLAAIAIAAADRLAFPDHELPLAIAGGVLIGEETYREAVLQRIQCRRQLRQVAVVTDPARFAAQRLAATE